MGIRETLKNIYQGLQEKQGFSATHAQGVCDQLYVNVMLSKKAGEASAEYDKNNGWENIKGIINVKG